MSDVKLGKVIEGEANRDCIHIAIIPLIAGENLFRGQQIRLKFGSSDIALCGEYNDSIGIVDPFLKGCVNKNQRFYGFLTPGTVTGMRHHWEHPLFDKTIPKLNEHEEWLREFCDKWNFDYNELL